MTLSAHRPVCAPSPPNRSLALGRSEGEIVHCLTKALLLARGASETALNESFGHAMAGLGAAKGLLIMVRQEQSLEHEILYSTGLSVEDETACRELLPSPGITTTLIRRAIESSEAQLVADAEARDDCDAPRDRRTVICPPVTDPLTSGTVAVLYFQNDAKRAYAASDLEWRRAYAAALGQALSLYSSGQRQLRELGLGSEWRPARGTDGPEIVGESEATRQLGHTLNTLLPSTKRADAPAILVLGESGTGKELVARYLHCYSPKRTRGPFQAFNFAGLRGDLAESRLFGHVRGAFTGANADAPGLFRAANNGVLLLDAACA